MHNIYVLICIIFYYSPKMLCHIYLKQHMFGSIAASFHISVPTIPHELQYPNKEGVCCVHPSGLIVG